MVKVVFVLAYLILAPFLGALLDGVDRIISARMQRRKGCTVPSEPELSCDPYDRRLYALRGSRPSDGALYPKYR